MRGKVFIDTHFLLALANPKDQWHPAATAASAAVSGALLTSDTVLIEVADALSALGDRGRALSVIDALNEDPAVEILPMSRKLFAKGLDLFRQRPDKAWSLTDCISFTLMKSRGIKTALTGDRHFEQAGFEALMRNS